MYSSVYWCLAISIINSSFCNGVFSKEKDNKLLLIADVGVPFTWQTLFKKSLSFTAIATKTVSSLKGIIIEKIPFWVKVFATPVNKSSKD